MFAIWFYFVCDVLLRFHLICLIVSSIPAIIILGYIFLVGYLFFENEIQYRNQTKGNNQTKGQNQAKSLEKTAIYHIPNLRQATNPICFELKLFLPKTIANIVIAYGEEANEWFCAQKLDFYLTKLETRIMIHRKNPWYLDHPFLCCDWGRINIKLIYIMVTCRSAKELKIRIRKGNEISRWVRMTQTQFIQFVFGIESFSRQACEHCPHFSNLDERLIKDSFLERIYDSIIF